MKYKFMIIPENQEERDTLLSFLDKHNASITTRESDTNINDKDAEQQNLPDTPQCSKCGEQVDQKIAKWCTHPDNKKTKGKILCYKCQEALV